MNISRYPVKQLEPLDRELAENWVRDISNPVEQSIHGVGATKRRADVRWRWQVFVSAMEFVRGGALEVELRRSIDAALRAVPGVAEAAQEDREVWVIRGKPDGAALVAAVATAIDARADEIAVRVRGG